MTGTSTGDPQFWIDPDSPRVNGEPVIKVVHGDFRRLVTAEDPAVPGEGVHVYMTGLGAVVPAQANFTPAPEVSPDTAARLTCRLNPVKDSGGIGGPVRVPLARLAPGMVGIYQVEVEIPQNARGPVFLVCDVPLPPNEGVGRGAGGYLPVTQ